MKALVVIDMQNDFITGSLGTKEAQAIVPKVKERIEGFKGKILWTRDTHGPDYKTSQEGRKLPVVHCVKMAPGWQICDELKVFANEDDIIDKPTFGTAELAKRLQKLRIEEGLESVTLIGVCSDICVISNALILKAALPETPIIIDSSCCAGTTVESHQNALKVMAACQVEII